jgi:mevalonate kinase
VYGFPSLGIGLPASTEIKVRAGSKRGWSFPGLAAEEARSLGEFFASAAAVFPGAASGGGEIGIASTVPRALGFGSSSALCVATAGAFAAEGSSPEEIWSAAHRAEEFFHRHPSGIDTGLSLLGGLRTFRPSPPELPKTSLLRGVPLHLVIGAVPRRKSTAALVGDLRSRLGSGDGDSSRLVEELGGIAGRAIDLIEVAGAGHSDAMPELGDLLGAAHRALGRLGLGDPGIDRLIQAGVELGALGGKQSGAGAGGAFFLLYPSEPTASASAISLAELARSEGIPLAAPLWVFDSP